MRRALIFLPWAASLILSVVAMPHPNDQAAVARGLAFREEARALMPADRSLAIYNNMRPAAHGQLGRMARLTLPMLNTMCAYQFAVSFSCLGMHLQIYCAYWWLPEPYATKLARRRNYGWGIASLQLGFGGGLNDGGRGYYEELELTGARHEWTDDPEPLSDFAREGIALMLSVDVNEIPRSFKVSDSEWAQRFNLGGGRHVAVDTSPRRRRRTQVPFWSTLFSVVFVGMCCFMPRMEIVCCCHNRCKQVCRIYDYTPGFTEAITGALVYCMRAAWRATYFLALMAESAFGLPKGTVTPFLHVLYFPSVAMPDGRLLSITVQYTDRVLRNDKWTKTFAVYLVGLATAGYIPLLGKLMNVELLAFSIAAAYRVAMGLPGECGTPTRGAVTVVGLEMRERGLLAKDDHGWETHVMEPSANALRRSHDTSDADAAALFRDKAQKFLYCAGRGELELYLEILERGIFKDLGEAGNILGPLISFDEYRNIVVADDFVEHLRERPWAHVVWQYPAAALLDRLVVGDPRFADAALAFEETYQKWLVPAPGEHASLARARRWWHWIIVCLREDRVDALPLEYDLDEDALDEESSVSSVSDSEEEAVESDSD